MCPFQVDELEQDAVLDMLMRRSACVNAIEVVSGQSSAGTGLQVELVNPKVYLQLSEHISKT